MTWRSPTWRLLEPNELLDPEKERDLRARFELWANSPSGMPIAASGQGLDMALLALHMRGYQDEVFGVLEKIGDDEMSCAAAVDFFIGYDMFGHVARHLEKFASACDYVLMLSSKSDDAYLTERIGRAQDMARTSLAKKYAIEAVRELELDLDT